MFLFTQAFNSMYWSPKTSPRLHGTLGNVWTGPKLPFLKLAGTIIISEIRAKQQMAMLSWFSPLRDEREMYSCASPIPNIPGKEIRTHDGMFEDSIPKVQVCQKGTWAGCPSSSVLLMTNNGSQGFRQRTIVTQLVGKNLILQCFHVLYTLIFKKNKMGVWYLYMCFPPFA